jgi:hypothetical protein
MRGLTVISTNRGVGRHDAPQSLMTTDNVFEAVKDKL